MSAELELHVAITEWDESIDPTSYLGLTIEDVDRQVRAAIEEQYSDLDPERDDVAAYVNGPGRDVVNFGDWHEELHEIDGTPWVTRETHTITLPASA